MIDGGLGDVDGLLQLLKNRSRRRQNISAACGRLAGGRCFSGAPAARSQAATTSTATPDIKSASTANPRRIKLKWRP